MQSIDKKYPRLVNCFGSVDYSTKKCTNCTWKYPCLLMTRELKRNPYKKGKYRAGFGRSMVSNKSVWWTGDYDDI